MDLIFNKLPNELHWNILKFLRHPVAEIYIKQKSYNSFLITKEDTYTNIDGISFQINDLINYYDIWKLHNRIFFRDCTTEIVFHICDN